MSLLVKALLLLVVLSACCAADQQPAAPEVTADEVWRLIDRAVAAAVQPLTSRLQTRLDTLDARLVTLDARLVTLDAQVDRLIERQYEYDSGMAAVGVRLDEHTAKQEQSGEQLSNHTLELRGLESRLGDQESKVAVASLQLESLETRLAEQASRPAELVSPLASSIASHETRLGNLTSQFSLQQSALEQHTTQTDVLKTQLEAVLNRTAGHQSQLDDIAIRLSAPQPVPRVRDCSDLPAGSASGVYHLPAGSASGFHYLQLDPAFAAPLVPAYCDLDTDGGRWTVIQRRAANISPHENFYRDWYAYREGFGKLDKEFWWGLENIWAMTAPTDRQYELRINMEDTDGKKTYAVYKGFRISTEGAGYRLTAVNYTGDDRDGLRDNIGQRFSTPDKDQDSYSSVNCAALYQGAWWYSGCGGTGLNVPHNSIYWNRRLAKVQMKIRPY